MQQKTPSIDENKVRPPAVRGKNGRFLPGNKTGGRKKMPEGLREMCRTLAPDAIETAQSIMYDKAAKASDRLRAAEIILDRAYGKAPQAVSMDVTGPQRFVFLGVDAVQE